MSARVLRLLIIGAHPDDADYAAGGTAALYAATGHIVRMVSLTNGDAGHHKNPGPSLARRRTVEAAAAGAVIGAAYDLFRHSRWRADADVGKPSQGHSSDSFLRSRSGFDPSANDYHPDHRYSSQLVQDAAYMVTVPAVVPGTRHLMKNPVIMYLPDEFQKPYPLQPTVAVDVGPVLDKIVDMLHCHVSQFYEWLPYNSGILDRVPQSEAERKAWLTGQVKSRLRKQADRFRALLIQCYGAQQGKSVEFAEAFEPCEYGAPFDDLARRHLFPFLPG